MRTDGVHRREFAGTGPVLLNVFPVTGAALSGIAVDHFLYVFLFPHPNIIVFVSYRNPDVFRTRSDCTLGLHEAAVVGKLAKC